MDHTTVVIRQNLETVAERPSQGMSLAYAPARQVSVTRRPSPVAGNHRSGEPNGGDGMGRDSNGVRSSIPGLDLQAVQNNHTAGYMQYNGGRPQTASGTPNATAARGRREGPSGAALARRTGGNTALELVRLARPTSAPGPRVVTGGIVTEPDESVVPHESQTQPGSGPSENGENNDPNRQQGGENPQTRSRGDMEVDEYGDFRSRTYNVLSYNNLVHVTVESADAENRAQAVENMARLAIYHAYTACNEHAAATEASASSTLRIYQTQMLYALQQLDDKWRSYSHAIGTEAQSKITALDVRVNEMNVYQQYLLEEGGKLQNNYTEAQSLLQSRSQTIADLQAKCKSAQSERVELLSAGVSTDHKVNQLREQLDLEHVYNDQLVHLDKT